MKKYSFSQNNFSATSHTDAGFSCANQNRILTDAANTASFVFYAILALSAVLALLASALLLAIIIISLIISIIIIRCSIFKEPLYIRAY